MSLLNNLIGLPKVEVKEEVPIDQPVLPKVSRYGIDGVGKM